MAVIDAMLCAQRFMGANVYPMIWLVGLDTPLHYGVDFVDGLDTEG